MSTPPRTWLIGLLLLLPLSVSGSPGNLTEAEQQLQQVREEIESLRRERARLDRRQGELQQSLQRSEEMIARQHESLHELQPQLEASSTRLASLAQELKVSAQQLGIQREQLAEQLRSVWRSDSGDLLRLLLEHDDPATLERVLTYHGYLQRAREEQLLALTTTLREVERLNASEREERERLGELHRRESSSLAALEATQRERHQIIDQLQRQIGDSEARETELVRDAEELETVLSTLRAAVSRLAPTAPAKPFRTLRGSLPWPVEGGVRVRFGSTRGSSGLRWRGIVIDASEGAPVQATASGRIVLTEWLRGYGLVIIVDHGDDYLTLYAHNQSLFREVGEEIMQGETIAAAGSSGGGNRGGVYFEIRHRGEALNPQQWLKK